MDVALAIEGLLPAAAYFGSVTSNTEQAYNELDWTDARPKPTWAELEAIWPSVRDRWAWVGIRAERNRLLTDSDWTQMSDSPLDSDDRTAWAAYRQALRDLPQTYASPDEVVWPAAPE